MSKSVYKVEYECDCGINYGSCGAKCAVILISNNSCDIYTLYHTDSHKYKSNGEPEPVTTEGGLTCFTENYLLALDKAINMKESNYFALTEKEKDSIFN